MKGVLIGCGSLIGLGLLLAVIVVFMNFSATNKEARLRNQANAQQEANTAIFDNMWKTIAQIANVNDDYKETFRTAWKEILGAQSEGGRATVVNVVMNHINPKLDSSLSKKLMKVIESSRKEFTNNQKQLIDIKREHDNLRTTVPSKWFVGNVPPLEITIVTSGRTKDTFESGKEDDIELRPGHKKEEPAPAKK
jgi:hypothetical protein